MEDLKDTTLGCGLVYKPLAYLNERQTGVISGGTEKTHPEADVTKCSSTAPHGSLETKAIDWK